MKRILSIFLLFLVLILAANVASTSASQVLAQASMSEALDGLPPRPSPSPPPSPVSKLRPRRHYHRWEKGDVLKTPASTLPPVTSPAWFGETASCQPGLTTVLSETSSWKLDASGNHLSALPSGMATCSLKVTVCGDTILKSLEINQAAGETCPLAYQTAAAPPTKVCCALWEEAKDTKDPCDPLQDADCDGVLNPEDEYLFDPMK
jgi:hypothetical protein